MRQEFKLQDPGEGVHEVEINEILVSKGDEVSEGDDVLVVESDKATVELPSPYGGRIVEIRVSEGDIAEVGDVLMVIDDEEAEEGAEGPEEEEAQKAEEEETEKAEERSAKAPDREAEEEDESEENEAQSERVKARRKKTAEREEEEPDEGEEPTKEEKPDRQARSAADEGKTEDEKKPVRAAPAARKLAKEEGIDLARIEPSGSDGQVTVEDVRAAVGEAGREAEEAREEAPSERAEEKEEQDEFGPVERVKLRSVRAATARAMARSWAEIPHVTHQDLADITELERWRRRQVAEEGDEALTLTPFVVKAAAAMLRRHPRFNASLDSESGEIVLKHYYNVNVAVATERGLITPVIRDVDQKPVRALAHELAELTERMHKGRASKQDLSGGTFTVTNVGGLGGTSFAPIINPPQSAILGCAQARLMPMVEGEVENLESARTEARLMLPLIVAFDHRILDGADAARFVNELKTLLEDVKAFALDV